MYLLQENPNRAMWLRSDRVISVLFHFLAICAASRIVCKVHDVLLLGFRMKSKKWGCFLGGELYKAVALSTVDMLG